MFLGKLILEEKIAFLKIAHLVAISDGILESNEQQILDQYAQEMNLRDELDNLKGGAILGNSPAIIPITSTPKMVNAISALISKSDTNNYSSQENLEDSDFFSRKPEDRNFIEEVGNLIPIFKSSISRKILLLEVMAIIYANNQYHPEQEEIIKFILDAFELSPYLVTVYTEWAKTVLSTYKQGEALINL